MARFVSLALVFAATIFSSKAPGQLAAREPQRKCGQIFITGNIFTRQNVILSAISLYPGQTLRLSDLRRAEKKLERLGIFKIDPVKGIRPTVTVLEDDGKNPYKDILVSIEETPTWSVRLMPGFHSRGGLAISVVFEERNFDPFRWPTSRDDLVEGGAFRGAGLLFRLELLQIPLSPFRGPALLPRGNFLLSVGYSIVPAGWSRPEVK